MSKSYFEILPSAARTASPDPVEVPVPASALGCMVFASVTDDTGSPSVEIQVDGFVVGTDITYPLGTLDPIESADDYQTLTIGPGLDVNTLLPEVLLVTADHDDTDEIEYRVGIIFY